MAVIIDCFYEGDLHCAAVHGPSQDRILTDAPVDNQGKGEHFSPTDLLATAVGTCMLTVMGIAARNRNWDMTGSTAKVEKEMSAVPRRHIGRLIVRLTLPAGLDEKARRLLEQTARACPVTASLAADTTVDLTFEYR